MEVAVFIAYAINPVCSVSFLAEEFGLERTEVGKLPYEHGLQYLHKVLEPLDNQN